MTAFAFSKQLLQSFSDLIYPPLCLHCHKITPKGSSNLCPDCLLKLELIDPKERCPYCFTSEFSIEKRVCSDCLGHDPLLHRIAAAFDYLGPAASLIRKLKYGDQPYLAKGAGAYVTAQFLQLNWPIPDLIVPVPISFTHWLERGYNQSLLLAESVSQLLNVPIQEAVNRKSGDYSQAGLNRQLRMNLTKTSFFLKQNQQLHDKTILLIDDVMTTGSTLRCCAEVLLEEAPAAIYGLTFCRAI